MGRFKFFFMVKLERRFLVSAHAPLCTSSLISRGVLGTVYLFLAAPTFLGTKYLELSVASDVVSAGI